MHKCVGILGWHLPCMSLSCVLETLLNALVLNDTKHEGLQHEIALYCQVDIVFNAIVVERGSGQAEHRTAVRIRQEVS